MAAFILTDRFVIIRRKGDRTAEVYVANVGAALDALRTSDLAEAGITPDALRWLWAEAAVIRSDEYREGAGHPHLFWVDVETGTVVDCWRAGRGYTWAAIVARLRDLAVSHAA